MNKSFNPHFKNNIKYLSNNPIVGLTPLITLYLKLPLTKSSTL
ncbi:hypothetical protein HMPREF1410_01168, partial [Helicobacter pylori GAM249T]